MRLPRHASLTCQNGPVTSSSHERGDVSRNLLPFLPSLLLHYVQEHMDQRSLFYLYAMRINSESMAVVVMLGSGLRLLYVVNPLMTSAAVIRALWLNSPNQSYRAFLVVHLYPLCYHSVILTKSLNLYVGDLLCDSLELPSDVLFFI